MGKGCLKFGLYYSSENRRMVIVNLQNNELLFVSLKSTIQVMYLDFSTKNGRKKISLFFFLSERENHFEDKNRTKGQKQTKTNVPNKFTHGFLYHDQTRQFTSLSTSLQRV